MKIKFSIRDLLWALLCAGMFCGWTLSIQQNSRQLEAALVGQQEALNERNMARGETTLALMKVQQLTDRLEACQKETAAARKSRSVIQPPARFP